MVERTSANETIWRLVKGDGPLIATAAMSTFGPQIFLGFEAVIAAFFSVIVSYSMFKRPRPAPIKREPFVPVPTPSQAAVETD